MRRVGGLFEAVFERENLLEAFWRARRASSAAHEVRAFESDLEQRISELQQRGLTGQLELGRFQRFSICDPKPRTIHAPVFEERVVHHALCAVIAPRIEKSLIARTFACRKGLGTHAAVRCAQSLARRDPWVCKLDVRRYFDSVVHDVVLAKFARLFKDRRLLELIERIVTSHSVAPGRGIPIGSLCSQTIGNLYLDPFDRAAEADERVRGYVRYMDDVLLFGATRQDVVAAAEATVARTAGLQLVWKAAQLFDVARGFPFLGWRVRPDGLQLTSERKRRVRARLRGLAQAFHAARIDEHEYARRITSVFGHVTGAGTVGLRRTWIERLRLDADR